MCIGEEAAEWRGETAAAESHFSAGLAIARELANRRLEGSESLSE